MSKTQTSDVAFKSENVPALRQFNSVKHLAARYDVTPNTVWRWARTGKMPKPVTLGEATTRWKLSDLLAWEATQEASQ